MFLSIVIFELCTDTVSSSITSFLFFFDKVSINGNAISIAFFFFSGSLINILLILLSSSCGFGSDLSKDCSINRSLDKFFNWFTAFKCSNSTDDIELVKLSKFLQIA